MTTLESSPGRERIVEVATGLFALHGYDGASTRRIAESAGLNIATLAYHVGGKRDLYLAVMERAHLLERDALKAAVARLRGSGDVLGLVDDYVDFCAAHPQIPALWMHRWLSDAADVAHLESLYATPMFQLVADAVGAALGPDRAARVDVEYLVYTVVWCVHGFSKGGVLDADGGRRGPDDPAALARFRAHLRQLVGQGLRLPEQGA